MVGATRSRTAYSLTDVTPARTIWVYRNGDPFYVGRKFVINHRYVPNFEAFMIQLNEGVPTSFGVRKLYTPRNGHSVTDLPQLQQGGRYVVAGREKFRKLNYFNIGAKRPQRKKRDEVIRPVVHSNIQVPSKWQSIYNKPRNINVFTNGDMLIPPVKILIPRFTLKNWNGVLGLVNEKVFPCSGGIHRLYTLNGQRVHGADDLEDNQFYVACGKEKFKQLPYWQHPKVPGDIQRHFSNLPGAPDKPPPKKPPTEPSKQRASVQPPVQPSKRGAGDKASVYYAKPEKASREVAPRPLSPDHGYSVYKAQESPKDIEGAREVQEDKDIQVDIPVDQAPAEIVPEEDIYSNVGSIKEEPEKDKNNNGEKERERAREGKEEEEEEEEGEEEEQKREKNGVFKKMFGFLFNKSKKKDGTKENTKHQAANEQRKSYYAANDEFFDAYDYD
ncbi:doublecortin domain-containing protein 2C [Pogona vitticeps]